MKATTSILVAGGLALQAQAWPVAQENPNARPGGAWSIMNGIKDFFDLLNENVPDGQGDWLWEIEKHPQMCEITMETFNGAACKAFVKCDDGVKEYNAGGDWNVCFVGGRQYFNDPRIGDFSITFSERDGAQQGEGLTTPILQLKQVGDWTPMPVQELAMAYAADCQRKDRPCEGGPYICWAKPNNMNDRKKEYGCGVPKIGQTGGGPGGISSSQPGMAYTPGVCGVHVIQYQKPDPSRDSYSLEITHIKDSGQNVIGNVGKVGPSVSMTSKLPWTLEIKTGGIDADPVTFAYGGDSWDSHNSGRCSEGAYDNGKREMDCSFNC